MLYLFVTTCVIFAAAAYLFASRESGGGLELRTPDPGLNVVGLVTANITAGTGFVYLLLNGAKNGLLACLLPFALLMGYRVLGRLLDNVPDRLLKPNFLQGISNEIALVTGSKSNLPVVLIVPLLVTFLLLLGFEMFATSQLLSALMDVNATVSNQALVALTLFITTVAVVFWGGEVTYKTDRIQAVFIVSCVFAMGALAVFGWSQYPQQHADAFAVKMEPTVLASLVFAAVAAFNTQLYSILNWNAVANASSAKRTWVLQTTGNWLSLFVLTVLFIGASMPRVWEGGFQAGLSGLMHGIPSSVALVLSSILVVGTTAIVLTTTQGVTLAISAFITELLTTSSYASREPRLIGRLLYVGVLAAVLGILGLLFFLRPDLFFFLLAIVSGAETMVPLIVLMMVLARRRQALCVLSNRNLRFYFALFVVAIVLNLALTTHSPTFVPYASLTLVLLSCSYSMRLYRMACPTTPLKDAA